MKTFEKYVELILQNINENISAPANNKFINNLKNPQTIEVLKYFADKSQNRDVNKYDNNPAFKNALIQAQQDGVVGLDQNGQLQVTDAIIDHINNDIDAARDPGNPLSSLQGQLVKPDPVQSNQITQANKTANTQAQQSLTRAKSQQKASTSTSKGNPTSTTVNPQTINPYRK